MDQLTIIPPRSGTAFILRQGQRLKVVDIEGEQVSDFVCYNLDDRAEYLSSGRTIDYAETIFLTKGHPFYSNRSNIMFELVEDTVGRHDFLLTPCSADTFRIIYGHTHPHRGCFGNLCEALKEYGISPDAIPICFNIFMHVTVDGETGKVDVLPPKSKAGDYVILEAKTDLLIGMTACSAEMSNNYSFKPIGYQILN
ncbi:urea carboxylase-associated family protein [Hymenobacter taeanensis]|uniref:Urea carboxylase-associated family protein n=1 Tax=Hymenobacter taeanensis TaxID=2735321 RepID=A0A6M6BCV5_9BACT|nr:MULTISPECIES: urea carboxylase-associated family protein [Hymenobacter]QJX45648.1 urea carboxylase-associated family protein [Hymenobacter taeanensis]UOQ79484.1 urea carboxylase-associated family protein [Hymenobacter sp. 5414T-23]